MWTKQRMHLHNGMRELYLILDYCEGDDYHQMNAIFMVFEDAVLDLIEKMKEEYLQKKAQAFKALSIETEKREWERDL